VDRIATVQAWTHAYEDWEHWFEQWRNRREPGWFATRSRRDAPDPPAWLPGVCASVDDGEVAMVDACQAFGRWKADAKALAEAQQIANARVAREAPHKTIWWEHIHLDALWPMTQTGSNAFGIAGVHATVEVTHRVGVFVMPGAMLLRAPSIDGHQQWVTGTDWGFSYRMFDFKLPGMHRPTTFHLNMARVWALGSTNIKASGNLYLAGVSLTFKSTPPSVQK